MKSIQNLLFHCLKITTLFLTFSLIVSESNEIKNKNLFNIQESNELSNFLTKSVLEETSSSSPLFKPGSSVCPKNNAKSDMFTNSFPKKKKNPYTALNLNNGPVTYLIDYIEDAFKLQNKLIPSIFKSIFEEAKSQISPTDFKDPYSLQKLATGNPFSTETLGNDELYQKWLSKDKNFNKEIYENSVTIGQILTILKSWRWGTNIDDPVMEAKALVDTFDFNGDGRLNFREFIIAMIIKTKNLVNAKICTKCLEDIVLDIIEPMFTFMDCHQKNMINAQEIWRGLKHLNRKNPKSYDIYTCKIKDDRYRTTSVNDFVLKGHKKILGYITRKEFRLAILTAFWDRYATRTGVDENAEKKRKEKRWGNNGQTDNVCMKITEIIRSKE
jgi:Ca2+-binding EF-hand superfamily protein